MTAPEGVEVRQVPVSTSGPVRIAIWDAEARVFLVRRRTSGDWHIVRPLTALDYRVRGDGADALEGDLACTSCPAALTGKRCWALTEVEAYEEGARWFGVPEATEAVPA